MIDISMFNTPIFSLEHLTENDAKSIEQFWVKRPEGKGLQNYINNYALIDEQDGSARTYLIKDNISKEIVAYFTLRTGLITISKGFLKGFDAYSVVELSNFAVNDAYREGKDILPNLGSNIFAEFILPLVMKISEYVGVKFLYIFALPEDRLMAHYKKMGFETFPIHMEKYVYRHVKPVYDRGCRFMCQMLR